MDSRAALVISHAFQLTRTIERSGVSAVISRETLRLYVRGATASAIPPWYRLCCSSGVGGTMANKRHHEDQEQITNDDVVGKAAGEDEEFEDADEFEDDDQEEENEDVSEE